MYDLPCVNSFTLFLGQIYGGVSPPNILVYSEKNFNNCLDLCLEQDGCRGFNYNGSGYECSLLLIESFSPLNLQQIGRNNIGFYMESYNICNDHSSFIFYLVLIVTFIFPLLLYIVLCKKCCNSNTLPRSISQSSLIPSGRSPESSDSIPPPYQEREPSIAIDIPQRGINQSHNESENQNENQSESLCSSLQTNLSIRSHDL
jgi:hypothetical protein